MFPLFHFLLQAIDMHNNANSLDKALFLFFICSSGNDFVNGSKHNQLMRSKINRFQDF